jgi:hypothetical protein
LLGLGIGILATLVGIGVTYFLAGPQAVQAQRGLEADQNARDSSVPPIRIQDAKYASGILRAASSSEVLELPDVNSALHNVGSDPLLNYTGSFLPTKDEVKIGQIAQRPGYPPAQPLVFEGIFITVVGNHYKPVEITEITARVARREPPLSGTVAYLPPQGAYNNESIGFDLDSDRLAARIVEKDTIVPKLTDRNYFDERQITLAKDESLELAIFAFTSSCRCEFVLDIQLADGSMQTVDNHGTPWRISAFSTRYDRAYIGDPMTYNMVPCSWPCVEP